MLRLNLQSLKEKEIDSETMLNENVVDSLLKLL